MFGGIQGIMASDIQTRHNMISGTIREKRREREADTEEEEQTSLVTSGSNRPPDTDTTHIQ